MNGINYENNRLLKEITNTFELILLDYIKLKDIDFVEDFDNGYVEKMNLHYSMDEKLKVLTGLVNDFLNPRHGEVRVFLTDEYDFVVDKKHIFVEVDKFKINVLKKCFEKVLFNYSLGGTCYVWHNHLICLPL